MATQHGINVALYGAFEGTYGTAPASGFFNLPFISHTLGAEHALEEDDTMSGRKELAPEKGATEAGGDVIVPLEAESLGFWLKGMFGAPTTTGTGPYTHVYESGGTLSLPSLAIETWMNRVPFSSMVTGCVIDTMAIELSPEGKLQARFGIIAQTETTDTSSNAGSPSSFAAQKRFPATSAALERNGSALTSKGESGSINISNELDTLRAVDGTGLICEINPNRSVVTGEAQLRFADTTMLDQAIGHTASTLSVVCDPGGDETLTILMHEVYLPRPKVTVDGPGGVQASFTYRAVRDGSNGKQATFTLVNNTSGY